MDYFITILIFGAIIVGSVGVIYVVHDDRQRRAEMGFPKEQPDTQDCIEAANLMTRFVWSRLSQTGVKWDDPYTKYGMGNGFYLSSDGSGELADFVRLCHMAGCRVTIEQVSDEDIEDPKNTKEVMKKFHSDLKIARHERIEKYYRKMGYK